MSSQVFSRLLQKAAHREHTLVEDIGRFWKTMELTDLQMAHRLAIGLQEAHEEFLDKLEPLAASMGRKMRGPVCPSCGDPNCPGAGLVESSQILQIKEKLMEIIKKKLGGPPPGTVKGGN